MHSTAGRTLSGRRASPGGCLLFTLRSWRLSRRRVTLRAPGAALASWSHRQELRTTFWLSRMLQ